MMCNSSDWLICCDAQVANDAGELEAQASACLNLGLLYNDKGIN